MGSWDAETWFRGGLVFKSHGLLYHSTLGLRVIKKKRKMHGVPEAPNRKVTFKLPVFLKLTNTEPFAAWRVVTGDGC